VILKVGIVRLVDAPDATGAIEEVGEDVLGEVVWIILIVLLGCSRASDCACLR
jgi:hypothetical protein